MQNIEQVFLYMKDEITSAASVERQAILDEVKKLEEHAEEQFKEFLNTGIITNESRIS